jgi:hypothetical protein
MKRSDWLIIKLVPQNLCRKHVAKKLKNPLPPTRSQIRLLVGCSGENYKKKRRKKGREGREKREKERKKRRKERKKRKEKEITTPSITY